MVQFSVLVLLYNAKRPALEGTLRSILLQEDASYEIILADDGSQNDCLMWAEEYLKANGCRDYKVSTHENMGTVKNILLALTPAEGKYVKPLGTGDFFFDTHVLRDVWEAMEGQESVMCFGRMLGYDEGGQTHAVRLPNDLAAFYKQDKHRVKMNMIVHQHWVVGADNFYLREAFARYLQKLDGKVIYCEDMVQLFFFLEDVPVTYMERPLILYECASGVSTQRGSAAFKRMVKDLLEGFTVLKEDYPKDYYVNKGWRMALCQQTINRPLLAIRILLCDPGYYGMLFRTALQAKYYRVEGEGMLRELLHTGTDPRS